MNNREKFLIVFYIPIILFFCMLTGISDLFLSLRENCDMRDTVTPYIDLYPNSVALKSRHATTFTNKSYTTHYMVEAPINKILDFYAQYGKCNAFSDGYQCFGRSQSFGVYTITIRRSTDTITEYDLEIRWDICPKQDGIEFSPVE